jgi:ANTAR domain
MSVNGSTGAGEHDDVVVRKAERGWIVGDESVADLTSAMVLADLFAADHADGDDTTALEAVDENAAPRRAARQPAVPAPPAPRASESGAHRLPTVSDAAGVADLTSESGEAERLAVTVAQLEHALASRVRVEQAIGVLAERHRLRPREAFDLLRKASRSRGARVTELAQDVVASTANPLLRLPDELSRAVPEPRQRTRSLRRGGRNAANP